MSILFRRLLYHGITPTYQHAGELRAFLKMPLGVRRIAHVLNLFAITSFCLFVFLPFAIKALQISAMQRLLIGSLLLLSGSLFYLLAEGLKAMKVWALYSFVAMSCGLYMLFLMRITSVLSYGAFITPMVNVAILLVGCLYVLRPTVRLRFVR